MVVYYPNEICRKSKEIVDTLLFPLSLVNIKGTHCIIHHLFHVIVYYIIEGRTLLKIIYNEQDMTVMTFLVVSLLLSLVLCFISWIGFGFKVII